MLIAQVPPQQVWPDEHVDTHVPVDGLHVRHWLALQGAARQVEPHTLAVGQHVPLRQVPLLPQQVAEL